MLPLFDVRGISSCSSSIWSFYSKSHKILFYSLKFELDLTFHTPNFSKSCQFKPELHLPAHIIYTASHLNGVGSQPLISLLLHFSTVEDSFQACYSTFSCLFSTVMFYDTWRCMMLTNLSKKQVSLEQIAQIKVDRLRCIVEQIFFQGAKWDWE